MPLVRQAVHIAELFSVNRIGHSVQSEQSQTTLMPLHREYTDREGLRLTGYGWTIGRQRTATTADGAGAIPKRTQMRDQKRRQNGRGTNSQMSQACQYVLYCIVLYCMYCIHLSTG
jgi:hypothetical protein